MHSFINFRNIMTLNTFNYKTAVKCMLFCLLIVYVGLVLFNQVDIYSSKYIINDDVRNVSYYFHRLNDPELFQDDLLADIGIKLGSPGWKALCYIANLFVDPFLFSKIFTHFLFLFTVFMIVLVGHKMKSLTAGVISALIFVHDPFQLNRMAGALPRAFFIPMLLVFIYFSLRRSKTGISLAIFLGGMFYPILLFFEGIFSGFSFLHSDRKRDKTLIFAVSLLSVVLTAGILALTNTGGFTNMVTYKEAVLMPDFYAGY